MIIGYARVSTEDLVGQKKAVSIAVKNVSGRRRCSKLDEWLQARQSAVSGLGMAEQSRGAPAGFWNADVVSIGTAQVSSAMMVARSIFSFWLPC